MRLIFLFPLFIMLGSCINNKMFVTETQTTSVESPGGKCETLVEILASFSNKVIKPESCSETKPINTCNIREAAFATPPTMPDIVIRQGDAKEDHYQHIEKLITHIEKLNRYIEQEQTKAKERYIENVINCTQ